MHSINDLENLTLIIPTYNRKEWLLRLVNFYLETNINLIVLDGSPKPNRVVADTGVRYIHISGSNLHERLLYATKFITTKYIAICADDDFLFLRGLKSCVKFLDANPEYSSVQGAYIRFNYDKFFSWRPDYAHWNKIRILNNNPVERTLQSRKSCQFLYSTMHANTFKTVVSAFTEVNSGSLTMNELAFNYIVPFLGKYRTLPVIYGARIEHDKSHVNIEFHKWISSEDKSSRKFVNNIQMVYSESINHNESIALEQEMTRTFVKNSAANDANQQNSHQVVRIVRALKTAKYLSMFRPIRSIERIKWFLFLGVFFAKDLTEIRNLKEYLKQDSDFHKPIL